MRRQSPIDILRQFNLYKTTTDEIITNLRKRIDFLEEKTGFKYEPENKVQKINEVEMSMIGNNDGK